MNLNFFKKSEYPNGFTLAEVLITLVIIGVIAAMTVPAVINTYVESSTVSKVKKAQSILGQAKLLAEAQNGPITDWDFNNAHTTADARKFWRYIRPYIQVAKDCGDATDCYHSEYLHYLNGTVYECNYNLGTSYYKFVLSDGSVMWFRTGVAGMSGYNDETSYAIFWYDVNGENPPNTIGRDVFTYVVHKDGVFPYRRNDCSKTGMGWGCTAYIIKNSNMKYLH